MSEFIHEALAKHGPPLIPINEEVVLVDPNRLVRMIDPFRFYDPDNTMLMESIRLEGQILPVVVWALPDGSFGYISGQRRIDACKALGIQVKCLLGLPPADQAEAYKLFLDANRVIQEIETDGDMGKIAGETGERDHTKSIDD